jgi:transcriptional regulator with XRE-family HTH domain
MSVTDLLAHPAARKSYEEALLTDAFLEQVSNLLEKRGVPQRALAERLGVSEGRVSQILSGRQNLTVRTLANLATVLEARFCVSITDLDEASDGPTDVATDYDAPAPHAVRMKDLRPRSAERPAPPSPSAFVRE